MDEYGDQQWGLHAKIRMQHKKHIKKGDSTPSMLSNKHRNSIQKCRSSTYVDPKVLLINQPIHENVRKFKTLRAAGHTGHTILLMVCNLDTFLNSLPLCMRIADGSHKIYQDRSVLKESDRIDASSYPHTCIFCWVDFLRIKEIMPYPAGLDQNARPLGRGRTSWEIASLDFWNHFGARGRARAGSAHIISKHFSSGPLLRERGHIKEILCVF